MNALCVFLASAQFVASQKCSKIHARKEIRDLTARELSNLISALQGLYRSDSIKRLSREHDKMSGKVHGTPAFYPWHRHFLMTFQNELFKHNPDAVMPYWDWTKDSQEPHKSVVLGDTMMGGNGDSRSGGLVVRGPFNMTRLWYPRQHMLKRKYDGNATISAFANAIDIETFLAYKFARFAYMLEYVHGFIHVGIGGDVATMHSPNDPVFFLHHFYVDKLWNQWQQAHPNETQYDSGEYFTKKVSLQDSLEGYGATVKTTLDISKWPYCTEYVTSKKKPADGKVDQKYWLYGTDDYEPSGSDDDDYAITLDQNPNYDENLLLFSSDIKKLTNANGKIAFLKQTPDTTAFMKRNNWSKEMINTASLQLKNLHGQINASIEVAVGAKNSGLTRSLDDVEFED